MWPSCRLHTASSRLGSSLLVDPSLEAETRASLQLVAAVETASAPQKNASSTAHGTQPNDLKPTEQIAQEQGSQGLLDDRIPGVGWAAGAEAGMLGPADEVCCRSDERSSPGACACSLGPAHYEGWKHCRSTRDACGKVREKVIGPAFRLSMSRLCSWLCLNHPTHQPSPTASLLSWPVLLAWPCMTADNRTTPALHTLQVISSGMVVGS